MDQIVLILFYFQAKLWVRSRHFLSAFCRNQKKQIRAGGIDWFCWNNDWGRAGVAFKDINLKEIHPVKKLKLRAAIRAALGDKISQYRNRKLHKAHIFIKNNQLLKDKQLFRPRLSNTVYLWEKSRNHETYWVRTKRWGNIIRNRIRWPGVINKSTWSGEFNS